MTMRFQAILYAASLAAHALLAIGVGSIERVEPRPPIRVAMVSQPRREAPPPEPEPEVAEPPPPVETPPPPLEAPTTPRAPREAPSAPEAPAAEAPPPPAAPAPAAPAAPDFGIAMAGTGPGIAVPQGSPDGTPGGTGTGTRRTREAREITAPEAPTPQASAGGCDEAETRPRAISMPSPEYTEAARMAEIEGRVRVEIHVDASGAVTEARVLASLDPGLDEAALVAARAARFEPATRCGEAVDATFTVSIRFQL